MSLAILKKEDLSDFIQRLLPLYRVGGPVQVDGRFAFEAIEDPQELRLDYTTTLLPPKKYLLPQQETLFEYADARSGVVTPPPDDPPTVIFGVHTCDVHAIQLLDHVFSSRLYRSILSEAPQARR